MKGMNGRGARPRSKRLNDFTRFARLGRRSRSVTHPVSKTWTEDFVTFVADSRSGYSKAELRYWVSSTNGCRMPARARAQSPAGFEPVQRKTAPSSCATRSRTLAPATTPSFSGAWKIWRSIRRDRSLEQAKVSLGWHSSLEGDPGRWNSFPPADQKSFVFFSRNERRSRKPNRSAIQTSLSFKP